MVKRTLSLLVRLTALVLLSTCTLSITLATTPTFTTYQRIKNITAHDPSLGATYTLGQSSNELHNLIALYNTDTLEHDYTITLTLPVYLTLTPKSTSHYTDNTWTPLPDLTSPTTLHLHPFELQYIRFTSTIAPSLPNENLILTIGATIIDDSDQGQTTSTKVYIPNFQAAKSLDSTFDTLSPADQEQVKQLLNEEKTIMENAFTSLINNNDNTQQPAIDIQTPPDPTAAPTTFSIQTILQLLLALLCISFSIFLYVRHR